MAPNFFRFDLLWGRRYPQQGGVRALVAFFGREDRISVRLRVRSLFDRSASCGVLGFRCWSCDFLLFP